MTQRPPFIPPATQPTALAQKLHPWTPHQRKYPPGICR